MNNTKPYFLGLQMIVKDEAHVIERCLESVYKQIDYWAIVDTGSTDNTVELIENFFKEKGIPGKIGHFKWCDDFSAARNVALKMLEDVCLYSLFIDADEELHVPDKYNIKKIIEINGYADCYPLNTHYGTSIYTRKSIVNLSKGYRWNYPVHESLDRISDPENEKALIMPPDCYVYVRPEGASWKGNIEEKYTKHAQILEKFYLENDDPRVAFYIAQSWKDANNKEKAVQWYNVRANDERGNQEERYFSLYAIAMIHRNTPDFNPEAVAALFIRAFTFDPMRAEGLFSAMQVYQQSGNYVMAYVLSSFLLKYDEKNVYPKRILFVDSDCYNWKILESHAINCMKTGHNTEGIRCYDEVMNSRIKKYNIPEIVQDKLYENSKIFDKIRESLPKVVEPIKVSTPKPNKFTKGKRK